MKKYVAFLRAINVAGHASLNMAELRVTFQRGGAREVRTLIQSGNVLFEAPATEAAGVVQKVANQLQNAVGTKPAIMLRSIRDIEAIVRRAPFKDFDLTRGVKLIKDLQPTAAGGIMSRRG